MAEDDEAKVDASLPEEGEEGAAEEGAAKGKGKLNAKKLVLFVVLPLFILIGAGAGLYFSGALDALFAPGETVEGDEHEEESGHGEKDAHDTHGASPSVGGAYFLPMPDILVNLSTPSGQPRYLRLRVQLELESQSDMEKVEAVMPRVIDQFQTYLRELREKDLRGSAGIYRLQIELLARVNAAAYPVEVKDVLFQEFLVRG